MTNRTRSSMPAMAGGLTGTKTMRLLHRPSGTLFRCVTGYSPFCLPSSAISGLTRQKFPAKTIRRNLVYRINRIVFFRRSHNKPHLSLFLIWHIRIFSKKRGHLKLCADSGTPSMCNFGSISRATEWTCND